MHGGPFYAPVVMGTDDVPVADRLAAQPTRLANERTLLAYERTALGLGAAGVTMVHIFSATADRAIGWGLVAVGVILAPVGLYRYLRVASHLRDEPR